MLYLLTYNPSPAEKTATQLVCENTKITATTSVQNIKVYSPYGGTTNNSYIVATLTTGQNVVIVFNTLVGTGGTPVTGDICNSGADSTASATVNTTGNTKTYSGLSAGTYTFKLSGAGNALTTATTVQIQ